MANTPKGSGKCKGENRDWHVSLQDIITSIKFSLDESYIISVYDRINGDLKVDQLNINKDSSQNRQNIQKNLFPSQR